jgi:hypothetical protein
LEVAKNGKKLGYPSPPTPQTTQNPLKNPKNQGRRAPPRAAPSYFGWDTVLNAIKDQKPKISTFTKHNSALQVPYPNQTRK